jgi:copper chaperone NosL
LWAASLAAVLAACSRGVPGPAQLDARNDACAFCRMAVSDPRTAAQLLAPGEEPKFFDDIGCLRGYLASAKLPRSAVAYVADHRTRAWVRADRAVYVRNEAAETPMGSHLLAYTDAASRDADPVSSAGQRVSAAEVFGPSGPPSTGQEGK